MNQVVSAALKRTLLGAGHYRRRLRADVFPGVAVLCYHGVREDDQPAGTTTFESLHVTVTELEAHCRFVREACHPISLDDWRQALAGRSRLPHRAVLFTFDDGYRSLIRLGMPILARHEIPAVVFACSDPIERQCLFWYDAAARRFGEAEVERMKAMPYEQWWARTRAAEPAATGDANAPITVDDLKALASHPGIEIGCHTAEHPILSRANPEEQRSQIIRGKHALQACIGRTVRAFAYPNGQPGRDYTPETVAIVGESGFDFAFTTRNGFAAPSEPALERSRFLVLAGISPAELAHRLSYSWRRPWRASAS